MADLKSIFDAEHAELVEARAEVERLRAENRRLLGCPTDVCENLERAEHAEAEVERLRAELDRPKYETLRQLADAVERYDAMKQRLEQAEAQLAKVVDIVHLPLLDPVYRRQLAAAHTIDVVIRKDGKDYRHQGDFLKHLIAVLATAQPEEPNEEHLRAHPQYPMSAGGK